MANKKDIIDQKSARNQIKNALTNPNLVSVLIAGPSGCGKTYRTESVCEELGYSRYSVPARFTPNSVEGWQSFMKDLKSNDIRVLIIDHIEDMNHDSQAAMFHIFSNQLGDLSSFPNKENRGTRIIFTSLKSIGELRSNAELIMPHVYDRISQLIIRFDSLEKLGDAWGLFQEVWKSLEFDSLKALPSPDSGLRAWITGNIYKMNGNFRDLEKLAIRWHNRRLLGMEEGDILQNIIQEYNEGGFGAEPEEEGNIFTFPDPDGKNIVWQTIETDFRKHIRNWAIEQYGSARVAAQKLDVSTKTLERWKS